MFDRRLIVVTLRPEPRVDPDRAIKGLLKIALRAFGLRCVKIKTAVDPQHDPLQLKPALQGHVAKGGVHDTQK
jgi:hypothetical protein